MDIYIDDYKKKEEISKRRHPNDFWAGTKDVWNCFSIFLDSFFGKSKWQNHKSIPQEYLASEFYENRIYGEMINHESHNNLIKILSVLVDTSYLKDNQRSVFLPKKDNYINFDFNRDEIIDSSDSNAISQIVDYWIHHRTVVPVTNIYHLIDNTDFIDLAIRLDLSVISENEPYLSQKIMKSIMYASSKTKHGNPNIGENNVKKADEFALKMGETFDKMDNNGIKTIREKVKELNKREILSIRGKKWNLDSVHKTYNRWQKLKIEEENQNTTNSKSPKP